MDRRVVMVAAATAALVVLAAASGPVHVWTTPASDTRPPSVETIGPAVTAVVPDRPVDGPGADFRWSRILLQIVGVLIIVGAIALLISIRRSVRPRWTRRLARPHDGEIVPLPDVAENDVAVDIDAARAALAAGEPRNAIVACWMQLERDAAAAGLPRLDAETSAEYAERVVASSSVDPAPIGELAALYREARFSRHDLTDDHRAHAFAALNRVAVALRHGVKVAP
jgi:hypothetical protein